MKNLIVIGYHGARPQGWYCTVEGYGRQTALHWHLLTGSAYRQDNRTSDAFTKSCKDEQLAWLKRTGKVVITLDDIRAKPWKRLSYVGFFEVINPRMDDYVLMFTLGHLIAHLRRPSER